MLKSLLYFGYYLRVLNWALLRKFQAHYRRIYGLGTGRQWILILVSSLRYKISILEFYQFNFFSKSKSEKEEWAGTGFMYEYQKIMNPLDKRHILDDKRLFYRKYRRFFKHHVLSQADLSEDLDRAELVLSGEKIVLKESDGKCGLGTAFFNSKDFVPQSLLSFMQKEGYDLVESYIQQHPDLQALSPSGVNTVRIFTQLNNHGEVEILGCRQRISVNSEVDNLAAGNLAAPIDKHSGIITGPGSYSDITRTSESIHPVTGVPIVGFQVPFWSECLSLAEAAALEHPENRSIGWDIVVTNEGPGLIEGNHDWCKLVWQLPVKKGLKAMLLQYV